MKKDPSPTDVSIITTYRCCMKCRMCDIWRHPSDIAREIQARELEILPELKIINITGGEPLVRNDLADILEVCFTKAPRVVISTAGYHVDEILALAERFPHIGVRVSLEGLSTISDFLRGRDGGFDRGMKTLQGLREMGIRDIGIAITVSDKNHHELLPIFQMTRSMGMDFATATFHNSYYFHKEDNTIREKDRVAESFFELANLLMKDTNPKNWFRSFFNVGLANYIYGNKRLLPCEAGTVNFFIDPYGEAYPCNGLEERYWKESMGNIRDVKNFEELWQGEKAVKVRELVSTCPKNCWMVGTAAPVMKKYIRHPLGWVLKNKLKTLMGGRIDQNSIPCQYPVGQSPLQGDLRGGTQFAFDSEETFPITTPVRLMTRVKDSERLTKDTFLLKVERGNFRFIPGQNASIGPWLRYDQSRDYTLCSPPGSDTLDFMIKEVKKGAISPWLGSLKSGDRVEVLGPYGDFFISEKSGQKYLFIATGVGIGPFLSFIRSFPELDYLIVHGIRFKEDLILARGVNPERYISCITREQGGSFRGRVTDFIAGHDIPENTLCYLCGNPYMLQQAEKLLLQKGVPEDRILKEPYYAY